MLEKFSPEWKHLPATPWKKKLTWEMIIDIRVTSMGIKSKS